MIKSVSLTCTSSKTANTATGSTAEMRLPKSKKSSRPACTLGATRERQREGWLVKMTASDRTSCDKAARFPTGNKSKGNLERWGDWPISYRLDLRVSKNLCNRQLL